MRRITLNHVVVLMLVVVGTAMQPATSRADGLIWRLPEDGTRVVLKGVAEVSVRFVLADEIAKQLTPEAKAQMTRMQELKHRMNVAVASVGEALHATAPCRWIELSLNSGPVGDAEGEAGDNAAVRVEEAEPMVLKLLVAEKYLARGADPLDSPLLTFYSPKDVDKAGLPPEPGFNRIQYEIDRFRSVFALPLQDVKQLSKQTIETPVGVFVDCEIVSGVTEFDRPLMGRGRWAMKSRWRIALHPDAPFGVVRVQCTTEGSEFSENLESQVTSEYTLTLTRIERDARSRLPAGEEAGESLR